MDEKVKEQILVIRDTGLTNMFDVNTVQRWPMRETSTSWFYTLRITGKNT